MDLEQRLRWFYTGLADRLNEILEAEETAAGEADDPRRAVALACREVIMARQSGEPARIQGAVDHFNRLAERLGPRRVGLSYDRLEWDSKKGRFISASPPDFDPNDPVSVAQWLYLQIADFWLMHDGRLKLAICPHCGRIFLKPRGGEKAVYCSERHRKAAYKQRKRQATLRMLST